MPATTTYTQDNRRLLLETPLGKDALILVKFSGDEAFSTLFEFELDVLSTKDSIAAKDIVGKNVTFTVEQLDGKPRYFNGFVSRFSYHGQNDRLNRYTLEVVPWLWFLTRNADCRIFQNKTTAEIIEQVFKDRGFSDFALDLKGKQLKREYCVQYRETDFDFVSRLMEEEGIFYFFKHSNGKHQLMMTDHKGAYTDCPEKEVEFLSPTNAQQWTDMITSWEHQYEFRSGVVAHTDYNFTTPTAPMHSETPTLVKLDNIDKFELYDYPGLYEKKADGETRAKVRMEEEEANFDTVSAEGKCSTFFAGGRFKMARHHAPGEEGKSYVITSIHHDSGEAVYTSGGADAPNEYSNSFTCIPDSVTFRPPRTTEKELVYGSQTAVVVGPAGEEIYTDPYGRVKVQFHWDREGKKNENSSCWIRVAQPWAGKQTGSMLIPRIGWEVVVQFLEGDPDRPLIVGHVYNAEAMPPYKPEDFKTMSTFKTLTSPGGGGFNELRFEDKAGSEQIFLHAQKNLDARIINDRYEWIGHDHHAIVVQNHLEKVDNDRHEIVKNDHVEEIGRDRHLKVVGKEAKEVGESYSLTVNGDVAEIFKGNHASEVTGDIYLKGANIVIEGNSMLTLKAGGNSIVIGSSGVVVTASSMLGLNGSPVLINSGGSGSPGSGAAGSAVAPTAPKEAKEADQADPGEVAKTKSEQMEKKQGKYGEQQAKPHKPSQTSQEEKKKSWIDIKLVDKDGDPVPGEAYKVTLPDGETVASGTLDDKGFAHIENVDPGNCKVTFPTRDKSTWKAK